jgi:formylmethanofuran dehydrogenase subunit D
MKYYDYEWDLSESRILMDAELDVDKLGWKEGDYFRLTYRNGHVVLVKIDPLELFLETGTTKHG